MRCGKRLLASGVLILALWSPLWAQEPAERAAESDSSPSLEDLASLLLDHAAYLITSPTRIRRESLPTVGLLGAGFAALLALDDFPDESVRDLSLEVQSPTLNDLESLVEPFGGERQTYILVASSYGAGLLLRDKRLRRTALMTLEATLFTAGFTSLGKKAFGRRRPVESEEPTNYFDGGTALPSAHTSRAFTIATVVAEEYGGVVSVAAYGVATLVGLSRIYNQAHWTSDVLAGAVLGIAVGKAIHRLNTTTVEVQVGVTPSGVGVAFSRLLKVP